MNIVLLTPAEAGRPLLSPRDERALHVRKVLRKVPGDSFLAGVEGAGLREATIVSDGEEGMLLSLGPERPAAPLLPVTLLLGFPRPIQANRILKDLCSIGVSRILLSGTDLGEKSYREGSFFADSGWERAIREGASQAGSPLLPAVSTHGTLEAAIAALDAEEKPGDPRSRRIALDAEGEHQRMGSLALDSASGVVLAVGSERGWTARERGLLSSSGFEAASLGGRILRTETACLAATAVALSLMGAL